MSILVCEDGMQVRLGHGLVLGFSRLRRTQLSLSFLISLTTEQLWSEADAEVRKAYYDRNAIGWVARPKHGFNGFVRKGRFKKVSSRSFPTSIRSST